MELVNEYRLRNGRVLKPGVEFTALTPRLRKRVRLRYRSHGHSPSANAEYISGTLVKGKQAGIARTVWATDVLTIHRNTTERRYELPKPKPRRGR